MREAGINYLKQLQQNHSKVKNIPYQQMELMQYLKSPIFTTENMKLLLALRTRTVNGIRGDFSGMFTSTLCPLCGEHLDSIENLLKCETLKSNLRTNSLSRRNINHSDLFCNDVVRQKEITELYSELLRIREEIINSIPVAITGLVH